MLRTSTSIAQLFLKSSAKWAKRQSRFQYRGLWRAEHIFALKCAIWLNLLCFCPECVLAEMNKVD